MRATAIVFCSVTLALTLALCWVLFPLAAMSEEELLATRAAVDAEDVEDVSIGDFGDVPVLDLILHYIDNPPAEGDAEQNKVRFQGC